VKVHSLLCDYLKSELPVFSKEAKQKKMAAEIEKYIAVLQKKMILAPGDFLNVKMIQGFLGAFKLEEFKDMNHRYIDILDIALKTDIPRLLDAIQDKQLKNESIVDEGASVGNPFEETQFQELESWVVDSTSKLKYDNLFASLKPQGNPPKVSGGAAKPVLMQSGLPVDALKTIWDLVTDGGAVDEEEFALMMFLVQQARQNGVGALPKELPRSYIPPSKRQPQPSAPAPYSPSPASFFDEPQQRQAPGVPGANGGGYYEGSGAGYGSGSGLYPHPQ
jgi:Domain of unknown function (DUF5600)/Cytoskeletal-regulatory complex EF hand